jgi:hypothetical protein
MQHTDPRAEMLELKARGKPMSQHIKSTGVPIPDRPHTQMRIEQRGETRVLRCCCCNLPYAMLDRGRLLIRSRHFGDLHTNALDLEDLKRILDALTDASAIMPSVPLR